MLWSFSESDLKRIEETASCAISIHSGFLTMRDFLFGLEKVLNITTAKVSSFQAKGFATECHNVRIAIASPQDGIATHIAASL